MFNRSALLKAALVALGALVPVVLVPTLLQACLRRAAFVWHRAQLLAFYILTLYTR